MSVQPAPSAPRRPVALRAVARRARLDPPNTFQAPHHVFLREPVGAAQPIEEMANPVEQVATERVADLAEPLLPTEPVPADAATTAPFPPIPDRRKSWNFSFPRGLKRP